MDSSRGHSFFHILNAAKYIASLKVSGFKELPIKKNGGVKFHSLTHTISNIVRTKAYGKVFGCFVEQLHIIEINEDRSGFVDLYRHIRPNAYKKLKIWESELDTFNKTARKYEQALGRNIERFPTVFKDNPQIDKLERAGRILTKSLFKTPLEDNKSKITKEMTSFIAGISYQENSEPMFTLNIGKSRSELKLIFDFLLEYSEFIYGWSKLKKRGNPLKSGRTAASSDIKADRKKIKKLIIKYSKLSFENPHRLDNYRNRLKREISYIYPGFNPSTVCFEDVIQLRKRHNFSLAKWSEKQANSIIQIPHKKK